MAERRERKKGNFFDIIKNLFWLLIFLQLAPIFFTNIKKSLEDAFTPKEHVGYLNVNGLIANSAFYTKNIQKFLKAPYIKAILVRIDSPGGFPGSAQAIFNELKRFREKKPVVAFIENMGTSAAYNIAAASSHIVSSPSALVGSIGVWLQVPPNVKDLAEDWKIKFRTIQSGSYKTSGSPFKDMTPEEKLHLQGVSDDSYDQFVKDIAEARNLSVKNHTVWADGKVFTGNQALKLKLIDKIGSQQDAIEELKKQALIEKEKEIRLVKPKRPSAFMRLFSSQEESENDTSFSASASDFMANVIEKVYLKLGYKSKLRS